MYAAFGLASPFTPALLQDRGLGVTSVGAFLALGTAIRALSAPTAGRVADRLAALRPTLSLCAGAAALASLLLLIPRHPALILGILFLYSVALAPVVPLSDALALAAATPGAGVQQPGFRYGLVRGTGSAAFIIGALAGGQAIASFGFSAILVASAVCLFAAALAALLAPELRRESPSPTEHVRFRDAFLLFRIPAFRRVLTVAALVLGGHALHDNFAVIRWRDEGIDPRTISILWSESVAAEVIVFFFIGEPLLRRIGPAAAAALSAGAAILRWIVMGATAAVPAMALIEPLHGLTFALLHLTCMQVLTRTVPREFAATAQAVYGTVGVGIATSALTFVSGQLYAHLAAHAFWVMAGLALLALPLTRGLRVPEAPS
ncbi:MAG: transporter, family, 3-phenylpropionic acid transporter [Methylobacteriaceae bacterium]|jgi:PPP family 3-phenylpropionic acid transporter|nr:transporter, family, 3-phenylpropionic acid transporter [Methylobacteriaceae bacterium]